MIMMIMWVQLRRAITASAEQSTFTSDPGSSFFLHDQWSYIYMNMQISFSGILGASFFVYDHDDDRIYEHIQGDMQSMYVIARNDDDDE